MTETAGTADTSNAMPAAIMAERVSELTQYDLNDLCDATEAAILDGGGFGWIRPPARQVLEQYWRGVMLVPERELFLGWLDGAVAGSVQLVHPTRNNEATRFRAELAHFFLAPWARSHGLANLLLSRVEDLAREAGFAMLNLDVRASQERAIRLYESRGYQRWGTNPSYALVDGQMVAGHYYSKTLGRRPGAAS